MSILFPALVAELVAELVASHIERRFTQENPMNTQGPHRLGYQTAGQAPSAAPGLMEEYITRTRLLNERAENCTRRLQNVIERLFTGPMPRNDIAKDPHSNADEPMLRVLDLQLAMLGGELERLGEQVNHLEAL